MANVDEEIKALQKERESGIVATADGEDDGGDGGEGDGADGQVALTGAGAYDRDIYGGGGDKFAGVSRTVVEEEEPEDEDEVVTSHRGGGGGASHPASRASVNAPRHLIDGGEEREGGDDDNSTIAGMRAGGSGMVNTVIAERESAYQAKGRRNQMISPIRGGDAFAGQTPTRSFRDIMAEQALAKEKDVKRRWDDGGTPVAGGVADGDETPAVGKIVSDWDADVATPVRSSRGFGGGETPGRTPGGGGETPGRSRWDQTPSRDAQETPVTRRSSRWDQSGGGGVTPMAGGVTPGGVGDTPKAGSKWDDETPRAGGGFGAGETPSGRKKSRWDQTPQAGVTPGQTPVAGAMMTPGATPSAGWTPGQTPSGMVTPSPNLAQAGLGGAGEPMTPELAQQMRWERELDERNRPLTDEDLDAMFPPAG
ncbi:unnamed protein product [Ectocarpus sp. 13 AM-2016]